jgi:hypothetical protein
MLVFSFAGAGCKPEKEAVPDPERPPTRKVFGFGALDVAVGDHRPHLP